MWQQVSGYLQQVKSMIDIFLHKHKLPSESLLSIQDASNYGPLMDLMIYMHPGAYFLHTCQSICAGHFIVNRLFPALCKQQSDESV